MNVFDLFAKVSLDTSAYETGLQGLLNGIKGFGKMAGVALSVATTAVTAFATSSVKVGAEFDKSMSQVGATMLKTADEMEKEIGEVDTAYGHFSGNLRDFAIFLGQNTAFSAKQAADALNYMALAGYNTQESMEMLPNVLSLAAAGGFDLARASDMVTDAQTAFGISAERTKQMVDEMAKAASTGNTNVEQLGDAFLTVGGLAQELNGGFVKLKDGTVQAVDGIQEMEIMMTAMANAGIKGSEAGTHVRNMILKLSKPTKEGADMMKALGLEVFDADGHMRSMKDIVGDLNGALGNLTQEEKITAIASLFNTRDLASAEALLGAVGQDWDEIGEAILNAEGSAAEMANIQLDNLAGDVTLFKSALEGAQIIVSDQLTPTLRQFVKFGTDAVSTLSNAFQKGGLSGAMDALGTLLSEGINMIIEQLPMFIEAGMQLLESFTEGMISSLPTILVAGIQIVTSLISGFSTAIPEFLAMIPDLITNIVEIIAEWLPNIITSGIDLIMALINGITQTVPLLVAEIPNMILQIVEAIKADLPTILEAGVQILQALIDGILETIPLLVEMLPEIITTTVDTLMLLLPNIIATGVEMLNAIIDGLLEAIPQLVSMLPTIIDTIVHVLLNNLPLIINAGINILVAVINGITKALPQLIRMAPIIIISIVTTLLKNLPRILASGAEIVVQLAAGMARSAGSVLQAIGGVLAGIIDSINEVKMSAIRWGMDLIGNFVQGIKNSIGKVVSAAKSVANKVKSFLGFSEPEEGPLSNFHTYAPDMMKLFAEGVKKNEHVVADQLAKSFDFGDTLVEPPELSGSGAVSGGSALGGITINVYASEGQDVRSIADEVVKRMTAMYDRRKAVFA